MTKGIIYYTDNKLEEPIYSLVQERILKSGLPVVSASLKPINFGENIHLDLEPSIASMHRQILAALEKSDADIIFHCEHDVLYHPSHFEFNPPLKDVFYYNTNIWRWKYLQNFAITYYPITSLSNLCASRKLLLDHYKQRVKMIEENGWDKIPGHEPHWARRLGYEPGTKSIRQKLIQDGFCQYWKSEYPNIDIRHRGTITPTKTSLDSFKHPPSPETWREVALDEIPGWNLKEMFNL